MNILEEKKNADRLMRNCFLFDDPWAMEATIIPYSFNDEIDWNVNPFGDMEWTFMLSRHDFILKLVNVGEYYKEIKYLKKAKDLVFDFIRNAPFCEDNSKTSWRSIDSAIRIKNWIKSYDLLKKHNLISDDEYKEFEESVKLHIDYLSSVDTPFTRQSNWGVIGDSGLFFASVFLKDNKNLSISQNRLINQLSNQILSDGFHWEQSPMYHVEVLLSLFDVIEIGLKNNIEVDMFIKECAKNMTFALIKSQKPNNHQIIQGDSDDTNLRDIFTIAANLFNDGSFKYFADREIGFPYSDEEIKNYKQLEIVKPSFVSTALTESGNYYLRTGWAKEDSLVHFFCGSLGSGHGHSNLLHFDYSYGEDDILVDSGRFTYTDCKERYDLKSSKYHNSILVDDIDYFKVKDSWSYSLKGSYIKGSFIEKGPYKFVNGFNTSYLNINNVLIERKILLLKKNLVLVFDNIMCNEYHKINSFFHFDNNGVLKKENNNILYEKENLKTRLYFEKDSSFKIKDTLYSKHYNKLEKKPSLNVENKINKNTSLLTVINVNNELIKIKELEVKSMRFNSQFKKDEVRAFSIKEKNKEPYFVLFNLKQCLDGVDLFKAGEIEGYGKTLIYHNGTLERIEM